jgi:hypothetical protein
VCRGTHGDEMPGGGGDGGTNTQEKFLQEVLSDMGFFALYAGYWLEPLRQIPRCNRVFKSRVLYSDAVVLLLTHVSNFHSIDKVLFIFILSHV